MAHRSSTQKKLKRLRKAVNRRPLTAYIDLIEWLKLRGYAQTSGAAEVLLKDGKVKVDSHTVGRERMAVAPPRNPLAALRGDKEAEPVLQWVASPRVPAEYSDRLSVEV